MPNASRQVNCASWRRDGAPSSGVWPQTRLFSSLPADLDPASELGFVGAGKSRQFSLRPVLGCTKKIEFSPTDSEPGVRGEQVRPITSDLSQLGGGCVRGIDPAAGAMTAADAGNACGQELVSATHVDSLERAFARDRETGVPGRRDTAGYLAEGPMFAGHRDDHGLAGGELGAMLRMGVGVPRRGGTVTRPG